MTKLTNFPNGLSCSCLISPLVVDPRAEVSEEIDIVVSSLSDTGKTFTSTIDGQVYRLLGVRKGFCFTFVNMAEDGKATLTIQPTVNDGITYYSDSTGGADLVNPKETAKKGDYVMIASLQNDAVDNPDTASWQVVSSRGIWKKG